MNGSDFESPSRQRTQWIAGAPLVFVFGPDVPSVLLTAHRPCKLGMRLPDDQPNAILSGDASGICLRSFRVGSKDQLLNTNAPVPLAAFVDMLRAGAMQGRIDTVAAFMQVRIVLGTPSGIIPRQVTLCLVPLTYDD